MKTKIFFLSLGILLIFSGVLLFSNLAGALTEAECAAKGDFTSMAGVCVPTETGLPETPIASILSNFLSWILGIFGFIAIIAFVISGIQYLTAAGNETQIENAKKAMKWSLVGVIVGISGLVIIWAVSKALQATTSYF